MNNEDRVRKIVKVICDPRVIYEGREEEIVLRELKAHAKSAREEVLAIVINNKVASRETSYGEGWTDARKDYIKAIEQLMEADDNE